MSPLWLDSVQLCLFPGACWLQKSGHVQLRTESGADLLAGLDAWLAVAEGAPLRRKRVQVMLAASAAALCVLPWQADLREEDELSEYASACFARAGIPMDDDMLIHGEYPRFGKNGYGFALPRALLDGLEQRITAAGGSLRRVQPVNALAAQAVIARRGDTCLLLSEPGLDTALASIDGQLALIDEELGLGDGLGLRRLVARIGEGVAPQAAWQAWSAEQAGAEADMAPFPLGARDVARLPAAVWKV
ncbi:hypothetical protein [Massilia sp. TS11]|uniref:hypothetical protein n=1 Tax=Massilia sp. TS11 TaxID=2908003 RepID=UPI001EDA47C4|nr:hypothetical protein [Massilia sp. TS11]MCG2583862.1 hypothetical protein [Massilia sp. TS11]